MTRAEIPAAAPVLRPEHFNRLRRSEEILLAGLVLGALRTQRYQGGYVPARELPVILKDFPVEPAAIRKAITRARSDYPKRLPGLVIENRSISGPLEIRLAVRKSPLARPVGHPALPAPVLAILRGWFNTHGIAFLAPTHASGDLLQHDLRSVLSWTMLFEIHARANFSQGMVEGGLFYLDIAELYATDDSSRIGLRLLRSEMLLRRNDAKDLASVGTILDSLTRDTSSMAGVDKPTATALIGIARAHWLYRGQIEHSYDGAVMQRIALCRELLRPADEASTSLPPRDRGRLLQIKAALLLSEVRLTPEDEAAVAQLSRAEGLLEESIKLWRASGEFWGLQENLFYLADVLVSRAIRGSYDHTVALSSLNDALGMSSYRSRLAGFPEGLIGANGARAAIVQALEATWEARRIGAEATLPQFTKALGMLAEAAVTARGTEGLTVAHAASNVRALARSVGIEPECEWPWLYRGKKKSLAAMCKALQKNGRKGVLKTLMKTIERWREIP